MKLQVLDIIKITKPTLSHNPGFGMNALTGRFRKQRILEQATTPEDKRLLEKLKIKKKDKVLSIATYYASWASKIKQAGARVSYSDISKSMVQYAKTKVKTKFFEYIQSNYEYISKEPSVYDWTFTFEACGGEQGLPVAYLRSLLNNKGGILVYYDRKGKYRIKTGSKHRTYPNIVKTLAKIYCTKYIIKKISFEGYPKGKAPAKVPHMVFWIFTNKEARNKASLDIRIIDLISNKRTIDLEKESKMLGIDKQGLKDSLKRISQLSNIVKKEFVKFIEVRN